MAPWVKLAAALGVASAFASLIPSCAENNQTIFIRQIQAIRAPDCTVTADVQGLTKPTGFVDVGVATTYVVFPLIGNQMLSKGDIRQSKAEPNRVQIQGAEIELVEPTGEPLRGIGGLPNPYTVTASGTLDPATSSDAVYGFTAVEVMPAVFVQAYRKTLAATGVGTTRTVHAKIKVFGKTLGQTEVETGVFTYAMTVCYGCSVFVPAEAIDAKSTLPNCQQASSTTTVATRTVCVPGQDEATDCRACQGSIPLCTPCSTDGQCSGMISPLTGAAAKCNADARFCE